MFVCVARATLLLTLPVVQLLSSLLDSPLSILPRAARVLVVRCRITRRSGLHPLLHTAAASPVGARAWVLSASPIISDHFRSSPIISDHHSSLQSDEMIEPHHSHDLYQAYGGDKNITTFAGQHCSPRPKHVHDSAVIFLSQRLFVGGATADNPGPAVEAPPIVPFAALADAGAAGAGAAGVADGTSGAAGAHGDGDDHDHDLAVDWTERSLMQLHAQQSWLQGGDDLSELSSVCFLSGRCSLVVLCLCVGMGVCMCACLCVCVHACACVPVVHVCGRARACAYARVFQSTGVKWHCVRIAPLLSPLL
jgi:hypothetical protein